MSKDDGVYRLTPMCRLLLGIRDGDCNDMKAAVDEAIDRRVEELLPSLLAAMLEPEAVGKLQDAIKIASENP